MPNYRTFRFLRELRLKHLLQNVHIQQLPELAPNFPEHADVIEPGCFMKMQTFTAARRNPRNERVKSESLRLSD